MTDTHLRDEYVSLSSLLFKLSFAEIADLIDAVPMYGFDGFERFRRLTDGEVAGILTWMAGFASRFRASDELESVQVDFDLHDQDAVPNLNGFVLTELMGNRRIQAAYADAGSALGAMLKAFRAHADASHQDQESVSTLPAHLALRAKGLDAAKPRDRKIGLHILGLIAAHERGDAGCVANLSRVTLARRVVADMAQMRLTMPDGQRILSRKGGGPLSEETVIRDVISKYRLLG